MGVNVLIFEDGERGSAELAEGLERCGYDCRLVRERSDVVPFPHWRLPIVLLCRFPLADREGLRALRFHLTGVRIVVLTSADARPTLPIWLATADRLDAPATAFAELGKALDRLANVRDDPPGWRPPPFGLDADLRRELDFRVRNRHARDAGARLRPIPFPDTDATESARPTSGLDEMDPTELDPETLSRALQQVNVTDGPREPFAVAALEHYRGKRGEFLVVHSLLLSSAELSPALKVRCARALHSLGHSRRASSLLKGALDPDGGVLAADIAHELDRHERALREVGRVQAERLETLGAHERLERWRDAVHAGRAPAPARTTVFVEWRGAPWALVFGGVVTLGRSDASITVNAPSVSRHHLSIRGSGGVVTLVDERSRHGTFIEGSRLTSTLTLDETRHLSLGGAVECCVRAPGPDESDPSSRVVEVGGRSYLLALGPVVRLGTWIISREGARLAVRAQHDFYPGGSLTASRELSVGPGDALCSEALSLPELIFDEEGFDQPSQG